VILRQMGFSRNSAAISWARPTTTWNTPGASPAS